MMGEDSLRDPRRIKDIITMLTEIWEMQPDTRFNQLIHNLQKEYDGRAYVKKALVDEGNWGIEVFYPDLFFVEDDKFLEFLQWKYNELQKRK